MLTRSGRGRWCCALAYGFWYAGGSGGCAIAPGSGRLVMAFGLAFFVAPIPKDSFLGINITESFSRSCVLLYGMGRRVSLSRTSCMAISSFTEPLSDEEFAVPAVLDEYPESLALRAVAAFVPAAPLEGGGWSRFELVEVFFGGRSPTSESISSTRGEW